MERVPHNLQGLFNFCMSAGTDFSASAQQMDPETARWLREALESMTVDLVEEMRKNIAIIIENLHQTDEGATAKITESVDNLIDLTEDVNLADIFLKIGGLELLLTLFDQPPSPLYCQTGNLLANIVQNNEEAQKIAVNNGLLEVSLKLFSLQDDKENLRGIFAGISALVRSSLLCQQQFVASHGFQVLFEVLDRLTASEASIKQHTRFLNKVNFFLSCMCQELTDEQLLAIKDCALADKIAELALRFSPALPEFLLSGLVLLLTGRRSVVLDPDTVNTKPALKLSLRDDLKADLRRAIGSLPTSDSECAVDPELVARLKELLK
uniref:Hsp70-binding protein 1 n=1 Tax=Schistocephalus solidus TaxID=70667 RepID=A0A0X3P561_SCHSO